MNFSFSSSLTYTFCMLFLKSMSLKVGSSFSYRGNEARLSSDGLKRRDVTRYRRSDGSYPLFVARFSVHQRTLQKHHVRDTHNPECPPREPLTFRSYFLWTTSLWLNMFLMTIR